MDLNLSASGIKSGLEFRLSGSKSETNRMLVLLMLFRKIKLVNLSDADDSKMITQALDPDRDVIDVHHAGTAMRFLTAYLAIQPNREVVLTGSPRMKERPIGALVEALRKLGAEITYTEKEGFPPLLIKGKKLSGSRVTIPANISSQYITALLLIAPKLENGLQLTLEGEITSFPYIKMTLELLQAIGVKTLSEGNVITIFPKEDTEEIVLTAESDWSSASYFYSIIALAEKGTRISLSKFKPNSLQGDSKLVEIYQDFGVETEFNGEEITLAKHSAAAKNIQLNLNDTPDIAQTIAVTCFALGIPCELTGLHTLKIKETDRLVALETELTKLGARVFITDDSLTLEASQKINPNIRIVTYNDHRMAMAFAPLALKVPVIIENAEVVSKSFPVFWYNLQKLGFQVSKSE